MRLYYFPFDCEADFHKSVKNKQDLLYLIAKYGKNAQGNKYKKTEFQHMQTTQLRQIWQKILHKMESHLKSTQEIIEL